MFRSKSAWAVRAESSVAVVAALEGWMRAGRAKLSRHAAVAGRSTTCSRAGKPSLVQTARLNNVDPRPSLADVLARVADAPQTKLAVAAVELAL
jgi:hypothetical protein